MKKNQTVRSNHVFFLLVFIALICVLALISVILKNSLQSSEDEKQLTTAFKNHEYAQYISLYETLDEDKQLDSTNLYLYGLSNYMLAMNSTEGAGSYYNKTIKAYTLYSVLYPEISENLPLFSRILGESYFASNNYKKAIEELSRAKLLGGTAKRTDLLLGIAYGRLHYNEEAEKSLLLYDDTNRNIYRIIMQNYMNDNIYGKAMTYIDRLLEDPADEDEIYELYMTKIDLLDHTNGDVISAYHELIDKISNKKILSNVYFQLGELYDKQGDLIEARSLWNKAILANPQNKDAVNRLER